MNHSPFEEWLLSGKDLPEDQKLALQAHIQTCPSCSRLAGGWSQVEGAMKRSQPVEPAPGFTHRFQASLEERRAKQQRRVTWSILSGTLAATFVIGLILWLPQASTSANLIVTLGNLVAAAVNFSSSLSDASILIGSLLSALPPAIPIAVWMILALNICVWSLIWILCVWKLPGLLRSQNEVTH